MENKLLLTPSETAKRLSISERTLWTLTNKGEIACKRIGRAVRYHVPDLIEWIERGKIRSRSMIETVAML